MIKGLAITPPVLGRITIGKIVEKNGKRIPEKDDQFTITSQIQNRDGWVNHPFDEELRSQTAKGKLRTIPVTLLFNEPDLNFRVEYSLFDRNTGRPLCSGDGESCQRRTESGTETLPCPSPNFCPLAEGGRCKPYGRLNVNVSGEDDLGSFIFRTTGYNSIRTLIARLNYYQAVSGGLLACMPLDLQLRGKSTTQSRKTAIYYVDLVVRDGLSLEEAILQAQMIHQQRKKTGYNQEALDKAAKLGFLAAVFEHDDGEGADIVEEFYPTVETAKPPSTDNKQRNLKARLEAKAASMPKG